MPRSPKILLVGQGLAGSILGFELLNANCELTIYNSPNIFFTSSIAAGGLFNPVTGRKLEKTWLADELFELIFSYYPSLDKVLSKNVFHPMPLFRPFANDEMKDWLLERKSQIDHSYLDWTEDGVWIKKTGWVEVDKLIEALAAYFFQQAKVFEKPFVYENLIELDANQFEYESEIYDYVIFSEGFHAQQNNPYFKHLCFLPAKGELMKIKSNEASEDYIVNKNGFLLPIGDKMFKLGATYSWKDFSQVPSETALEDLQKKAELFGLKEYQIVELLVGVRPATQDRRPFVGFIPGKNIGIFNGFGSKGVSLAPYFAKELVENILHQKEINPEVSIHRFSHLFSV